MREPIGRDLALKPRGSTWYLPNLAVNFRKETLSKTTLLSGS
jgi:hypothetical protein